MQWDRAGALILPPPYNLSCLPTCTGDPRAAQDAGWAPGNAVQRDATGVVIGSGMSCTADLAAAGVAIAAGQVRKCGPELLDNCLAASCGNARGCYVHYFSPSLNPKEEE